MTQRDLAEASRVAQPNIAAFENGSRRPSAQMLERLHAAARPRPSTALAQHRSEVERVLREHKAVSAKVFGSVARDEDRPGSDLDLLVAFETGASLFDQVGLAQDLEDLLGVHVDVLSEGGLTEQHAEIRAAAVTMQRHPDDRTARRLHEFLAFSELGARLVACGRAAFDADEMLRLAAEAIVHRIGESVARLDDAFTSEHPGAAWRRMKGMRNVIAHDHAAVDHGILWNALEKDLPREAATVARIVASIGGSGHN